MLNTPGIMFWQPPETQIDVRRTRNHPLETQIATKSRRRDDEEGSDRDRGAHRGMTHPDEPMRETKRRTVTSTRQRMA